MRPFFLVLVVVGSAGIVSADQTVDYLRQVKPVLQARCYACHGVLKQEGGVRLDTAALAVKGGSSGAIVRPGDAGGSSLLQRISSVDESERMPPEGEPLKPDEIAAIKTWIAEGAAGPADEKPERDPREHWAFQTPIRPNVPIVADSNWSVNPIDAFLAFAHQQQGLRPQPAADKRIWLRRVTLDLIGLPPTREEMDAFLADDSVQAVDTVVNRLLDSPHYGERWGRHWMDIWRYSDWWGLGEESRNSQRHIWHWRDWIVESLNADKGYDQMLREMLAADELYPEDPDRLRAGGFLGRQYFKFNRTSWLDETIEHTGKAMLGLTFNCGKCHDHKYDPFTQADYYRFRAIFEPYQVRLDPVDGQIDFDKDGIPRPFDCNLDVKTYVHIRGDDRNPDTSRIMEPAVPAFLSVPAAKIEPVTLPPIAVLPGLRPAVVESYLKQAEQRIADKRAELETARRKLSEAERMESPQPSEGSPSEGALLVKDDFRAANPDVWETREGVWTYNDGKLVQSQEGAVRSELRLKQAPPADFEAKLKFVIGGGQTWKSVGLTFDGTDSNELLAYCSAHAPGPKAQFAYKKGDYIYPADATKPLPIGLGQLNELRLLVRGTLINIAVNGQPVIAYRLPLVRQKGVLQIITYDAQAEFQSFELRSLPTGTRLVEAATGAVSADSTLPVDQARLAVTIAEKALAWAEAQPDAVRARSIADRARYQQPPAENAIELARQAARAERVVAVAKSAEDVAKLELDVVRAATDKKADLESKLAAARTALEAALKAIDEPSESYTSIQGASKALESNLETEQSRQKPFPPTSTGRRTALAKWITDPRHPLTARVAVNHLWSRHFGRPLVPTVFDFGRKGTPPTHPELLDWLAVELIEGGAKASGGTGWSMKHIHRLIVTSNAYRLSSSTLGAAAENLTRDTDNRFYWRMNPIRMEAQVVRDSLLFLAGELDLTMGGPPVPVKDEASRRRSLYYFHSNIQREKFLSMFDDASVLDCYRRAESIVPQQALALENSSLAFDMAKTIAAQISQVGQGQTEREFVRTAFLTVLSVEPTEAEQASVAEAMLQLALAAQQANRTDFEMQAKVGVIQALLNHNDFVTVR
jgi:hypothetical protein